MTTEERIWQKIQTLCVHKELLGAALNGRLRVKLYRGVMGGFYESNGMMRLDNGTVVDCDPASLTGVSFEEVEMDNGDARIVIENLQKEIKGLKQKESDREREVQQLIDKLSGLEDKAREEIEKSVDELLGDD